jgi:hypothetical protein
MKLRQERESGVNMSYPTKNLFILYFPVLILSFHGYFHSLFCYRSLTKPDALGVQ